MAQVEVFKTVTFEGRNYLAGQVYDEKVFKGLAKDLKKRGLIGAVSKETADRLKKEAEGPEKVAPRKTSKKTGSKAADKPQVPSEAKAKDKGEE